MPPRLPSRSTFMEHNLRPYHAPPNEQVPSTCSICLEDLASPHASVSVTSESDWDSDLDDTAWNSSTSTLVSTSNISSPSTELPVHLTGLAIVEPRPTPAISSPPSSPSPSPSLSPTRQMRYALSVFNLPSKSRSAASGPPPPAFSGPSDPTCHSNLIATDTCTCCHCHCHCQCQCTCHSCSSSPPALEPGIQIHPCGHVFGATCLLTWLETENTCPVCRRELFVKDVRCHCCGDRIEEEYGGIDFRHAYVGSMRVG